MISLASAADIVHGSALMGNPVDSIVFRYRHEMLAFLDHHGVSPYNNHAGQQMRVAVHTRKVSQQNRCAEGAKTHALFLSLYPAADLQKLNPIGHVMQLAQTSLHGKPTNSNHNPLKIAA
jgi:hypothetical protein